MDLYIAEKPELAKAIKEALSGAESIAKGYFIKGDNIVTYAVGHLLELYKPDDYDEKYKNWSFDCLPIEIKEYQYKPKDSTKEQLKIICSLINDNRVSRIIHCGDADDEGQILIEEILNYAKNKKPVMRVLINDLTKEAIQKEIADMKPNSEFKLISDRGFARSIADWEVGMNLSRAYTIAYRLRGGQGGISVGRVQTPILSLIVNRDYENSNFKSKDYFAIKAKFSLSSGDSNVVAPLLLDKDERIEDENRANEIKGSSVGFSFGVKVSATEKKEEPPLPFNLLTLQTLASKLFGFSAKKTLEVTQTLREKHKAITYNRSDCEYLPTTAFENAPAVLKAVSENIGLDISKADTSYKNRAFDDSKLSAHYGIIPTQAKFDKANLSKDELDIYRLIAQRFLIQFFHPCEYISYAISFEKDEICFKTNARRNIKLGFKEFFSDTSDDDEIETIGTDLLIYNNTTADCSDVIISKEKTKPRPLYTMTSLLKDLNSVAKYVKDEKIKKLLLEKDKEKKGENGGIGTPATRSDMIEKLIKEQYIEISKDKKQQIKSTDKGKNLIRCCSNLLATPDMTALWYEYQKEIEAGNRTKDNFLFSVKNDIEVEIERIKSGEEFKMEVNNSGIKCPNCNEGVLVRRLSQKTKKYFWGCSAYPNCSGIFGDDNGKPILEKKEKALRDENSIACPKCNKGFLIERVSQKGFKWLSCSEWKADNSGCDAKFKYDNNGNIVDFDNTPKRDENSIACPKCNKGFLIERVSQKGFKWLSCSEWKAGCDAKYSRNENGELVEMIFNKN
ncbi:DNA topoisomerase [Campylobacter magnus]|uniref:DNA topoisomerase n=2 Tax=Campylobacter TaxID=194 RepID=UPI002989EE2A|nr:DNA topoisomerase [Campylobacter magnus]